MNFLKSLFDENERNLRKLKKTADLVEALEEDYRKKSDDELKAVTPLLKKRLADGESLDDVLPDAFAAVREASRRTTGLVHYPVQIMGGVTLHQGRIAEMKTGEGKTLVETLPAYLNALTGDGVHIVTVNDYLAARDAEWMGKIYRFLGLSVGVILHDMDFPEKKAAYDADITYGTNNEFGFDYLRDNMAARKEQRVQRGHVFAIVDEVDSILIDEARTPLIISGRGTKSDDMYRRADAFARSLKDGSDYAVEEKEKTVNLTADGVEKAERWFRVQNLSDLDNTELNHYINQALKARAIMKKDVDYIVSDGEVLIVDEFTGRVMTGRRFSEGLHQAIEAKEGVRIRNENRTLATITLQNYFRLYKKLSGMTGTAKTEEEEFRSIYNLDVVAIPTNLPMIRTDANDRVFTKEKGKLDAIIEDIRDCAERKQPVLVGTVSVEKSEQLSRMLNGKRIFHNVLNAKNHKNEAEIVAQAGRKGQVTIATNMAGRGTDIMLGGNPEYLAKQRLEREGNKPATIEAATSFAALADPELVALREKYTKYYDEFKAVCDREKEEVIRAGGLRVIGTERHESRRIDNQLRGRSGRQGDPGSSVFYISLEDEIIRVFSGDRIDRLKPFLENIPCDQAVSLKSITKMIESAQRKVESRNFGIRKNVLNYDDVMNMQREIIYDERNKVLDGLDIHDQIVDMIEPCVGEVVGFYADPSVEEDQWDYEGFNRALEQRFLPDDSNFLNKEKCAGRSPAGITGMVSDEVKRVLAAKAAECEAQGIDFSDLERFVLLRNVDTKWMDHIDQMDALRKGIGLRGYGNRNPVAEYQKEGYDMFEDMISRIRMDTLVMIMKLTLERKEDGGVRRGVRRPAAKARPVQRQERKIGRNDPCPCGSGKKYKNCCGRNVV